MFKEFKSYNTDNISEEKIDKFNSNISNLNEKMSSLSNVLKDTYELKSKFDDLKIIYDSMNSFKLGFDNLKELKESMNILNKNLEDFKVYYERNKKL